MHITIPDSTLLEILAGIVILIILLQGFVLIGRRLRRTPAPRPRPRPQRSSRGAAWKLPLPKRGSGRSAGTGTRDHGLAVARKYGREGRSPQWPALAQAHLAHEPACRVCGHRGRGLQVHHIKP